MRKKLKIGKAIWEWETSGSYQDLTYDKDRLYIVFEKLVKPNLAIDKDTNIRTAVRILVESLIMNKKIQTRQEFVDLLVTLRLTRIDPSTTLVVFMDPDVDEFERTKYMFWNCCRYINFNQLKKATRVQVCTHKGPISMCYTGAQCDDNTQLVDYQYQYKLDKKKKSRV